MSEIDDIRKQVRLEIGMGYRDCTAGEWARRCRLVINALDGEQAVRESLQSKLNSRQSLLIEAEALLCDPQGGVAANELAERIREALSDE